VCECAVVVLWWGRCCFSHASPVIGLEAWLPFEASRRIDFAQPFQMQASLILYNRVLLLLLVLPDPFVKLPRLTLLPFPSSPNNRQTCSFIIKPAGKRTNTRGTDKPAS